jgi:hypothetical protein
VQDVLDGNDLDYIFVNNHNITAITAVAFKQSDGTDESIAISSIGFNDQERNSRVFFDIDNSTSYSVFPKGKKNIKITYTYGYDPIPVDIQEACMQVTLGLFASNTQSYNPDFDSEKLGEYSYKLASGGGSSTTSGTTGPSLLSTKAKDLLSSYTRTVL